MTDNSSSRPSLAWIAAIVGALAVAAAGGWFAARSFSDPAAMLSGNDRKAIESVVRTYLLENPEVLPEAMENLQRKAGVKQLADIREDVSTPYPGAVLGNPDGTVTMVGFSDFACGFCRKSVADIEQLVARNPDLRIVMRDLPILSEQSDAAARMALAAAEQGKYADFYHAMFAAGRPGPETIVAAARAAGLDLDKARAAASSPRADAEIGRNIEMARQLGFNGTPSWVVGDELISGAVGADELGEALARAKS